MSNEKDGGPAFPRQAAYLDHPNHGMEFVNAQDGMTLRDYFAAAALKGVLASGRDEAWTHDKVAEFCFVQADALLAARNR